MVVKQEHVFLTVEYEKRYLNVWRQDIHGYSRFYVTPLCVIELNSIGCTRDEYSNVHRHIFEFNVKLWDSKAAKVVQNAIEQKNISVALSDILPLPMQMVRIGLAGKDSIVEADNEWRSNQDQLHVMAFEMYTRHEQFCNKMMTDAKNNTKHFLRSIKPYFEFTMVAGQREFRNVNLTGKTLQKSSFFSQLANKHADKNGIVYLQSKDLNRLTRDIYNKVAYEELISADYISSTQEQQIIKELLEIFKDQQIHSKDLTKDEWNSVFWDDIFARPDIQTDYANEVIKYDEKENKFKYDAEKDRHFRQNIENKYHDSNKNEKEGKASFHWFSLFKARARGKTLNENNKTAEIKDDKETNEYDSVGVDDFNKTISKENMNIKWTGMKFEPKDLALYRLNTKNLNFPNEIYFKRVVVTKHQTTQKIEIKAEPKSNLTITLCPKQDSELEGNCYTFVTEKMNWFVADQYCSNLNGSLVSIRSMFENMYVSGKYELRGAVVFDPPVFDP
uniref:Uncharacterized protein n=1 Tax=Panagrolaimus davidi TaxID=227884 RepID=A0A914PJX1_9BILA